MVTIIFEAHGTTVDNEAKRASGQSDSPLSPLGEEQARELGKRYRSEEFAAVFCSDLQRSYRTAEIAFKDRRVRTIKDARLRECDYGDLTGSPSETIEKERPQRVHEPFPNGESYEQTAARMKSFLRSLFSEYHDKQILVIGHRATQYGLMHWIDDRPLDEAVTAPWSWQPGWVYCLRRVEKKTGRAEHTPVAGASKSG